MSLPSRGRVIQTYKNLLHLGKNYPKGFDFFRERLKSAFMKNKDVTDPMHIEQLLCKAEYVSKELEALYMLRKYRTIKQRYYEETPKTSPT